MRNMTPNMNANPGIIAAGRNLTANYIAQSQVPNQRIVQPARVVQQYVQPRSQQTVGQLMNQYRPVPMMAQRPMMMPQQFQQPMMPQQMMMPQVRPMMVPQAGVLAKPCNCGKGKKGKKTKIIVSGGKKVKVLVKKGGKSATATIKPKGKGKSSKKSKKAAKKSKKKKGIFSKMEEESSERKVKKGQTVSIEAQLATAKATKTKKKEAAKKPSKKKKSKKDSKKKSDKPARSTMMVPVYANQLVATGARFLTQPGMIPVAQYQVPVQRVLPQYQVQVPVQQPMLLG